MGWPWMLEEQDRAGVFYQYVCLFCLCFAVWCLTVGPCSPSSVQTTRDLASTRSVLLGGAAGERLVCTYPSVKLLSSLFRVDSDASSPRFRI